MNKNKLTECTTEIENTSFLVFFIIHNNVLVNLGML